MSKINMPEYVDGFIEIFRIKTDEEKSYSEEYLEKTGVKIWYRELSVFDRTRYELSQANVEVTSKIRIPQYKDIDSHCVVIMNGESAQHEVYNATHVSDKNGFRETEITLKKPDSNRKIKEVAKDDKAGA